MAKWEKVISIQDYIMRVASQMEQDSTILMSAMAEDIRNILYLYTQEWYNRPEHNEEESSYNRTYEFLNSLTVRMRDGEDNCIEIGFDRDKLTVGFNGGFAQHEDKFVPLSTIIDEGWTIEPSGKNIKGSQAITRTWDYMKSKNFMIQVAKQLRIYGYNVARISM